jgi:transposase
MGDAGTLTMSARELNRLEVLGRVLERRLTQRSAAERLDLSLRQVERLCQALRDRGAAGLVSRQRGHPSNHKIPAAVRVRALDLVRTHYADFGPTFACEKLREQHDLSVSVETLRQWMSEDGIWVPAGPAGSPSSTALARHSTARLEETRARLTARNPSP